LSFLKSKTINPGATWVLHAKKFKETSLICEILTEHNGKIAVIINNTNSKKKRQIIQPFKELWLEYQPSESNLKKVTAIETGDISYNLLNTKSICGLYINELILKTTSTAEPLPLIFSAYTTCLQAIASNNNPAYALRSFEMTLLQALGYGIPFDNALNSKHEYFLYCQEKGFMPINQQLNACFTKLELLNIQQQQWEKPKINGLAKTLFSQAISAILDNKPLKCRELIQGIMS
jgi:DNA repair protein RecO (recombination protein O)